MTNNVKLITLIALFSCLTVVVKAQDYKNAIGLRFGTWGSVGATLKHFTNDNTALEVNLNYRSYSYYSFYSYSSKFFEITGLYEKVASMSGVDGLKYYYGGGPAVGLYTYGDTYIGSDATFRLGVAGIVGLEYKFDKVPISISADYMPSFNFIGGSYFSGNRGGFAVRYTF